LDDGITEIDDSLISMNSISRKFNVFSSLSIHANEYIIRVTGKLGIYGSVYFDFHLEVICKIRSITHIKINSQLYAVGEIKSSINFKDITVFPSCYKTIIYTLKLSDGSELPSFIQ
jgi:hypothetical protein